METNKEFLKEKIQVARGIKKADLVLKNAKIINVFTESIEENDVAILKDTIVGIGKYEGIKEIDLKGQYLSPGFIDGHIHLESSTVSPSKFENIVLPHGTVAVVTDPHEITNVAGTYGLEYMLNATKDLTIDVFFMMPSCVPATPKDEAGATILAKDFDHYYKNERFLGLAELMNSFGTLNLDDVVLDKIIKTKEYGKIIDGHGPFLLGKDLNAYVSAGVYSDHESSEYSEAMEKLSRGQFVMIREGTAAKNLEKLMPFFSAPYYQRALLVTDDKHPGDLIKLGHIDYIVRSAIAKGADPIKAIKIGTFNPTLYFGLKNRGAIAPGYKADLIVFSDLKEINVNMTIKNGIVVAENGKCCVEQKKIVIDESITKVVCNSIHVNKLVESDLEYKKKGDKQRVIKIVENEILTDEYITDFKTSPEAAEGVNLEDDILKVVSIERHKNTGHIGKGFIKGYGLKKGAVASSIGHDSHNIIAVGIKDEDIVKVVNEIIDCNGGFAVCMDGEVSSLSLPIAGLMTDESVEVVEEKVKCLKEKLFKAGVSPNVDPFMTLGFLSLPVIPKLRIITTGLIDASTQQMVESSF